MLLSSSNDISMIFLLSIPIEFKYERYKLKKEKRFSASSDACNDFD